MNIYKLTNIDLDVDFYPSILPLELIEKLFQKFEDACDHSKKRQAIIYGNKGIVYTTFYKERSVKSWDEMPGLLELKRLVDKLMKQKSTVCVIQRYPNGTIGIGKHRDREMIPGTRIAGLSLGAQRTIRFSRDGYGHVDLPLPSGSLYIMNKNTNLKWYHEILKDSKIKDVRISLTFRTYIS